MCPSRQHLQVLLLAFCNDFDLAAAQIAYPPGKCKFFGLIVRRESKADSLHPSVDDQMQPGAPRSVLSRHDLDPAPVILRERSGEVSGSGSDSRRTRKYRLQPLLIEHPH